MEPVTALVIFFSALGIIYLAYRIYRTPWFIQNILHSRKEQIEDILKQLFHVEQSNQFATFQTMAGALSMSNQKLLKLVEEMSNEGLLQLEEDRLKLTEAGRKNAIRIVRVHRLWEKYLSEKTGFQPQDWHDIAEKKEHQLTKEQARELSLALGHPRYDPHGDPIPTDKGEMFAPLWLPLPTLKAGEEAKIVHIEDEPETIYQQILKRKLHRGSRLKVISSEHASISFESEGITHRLSPIVASNINVEKLNDEEKNEGSSIRLSSLKPGQKGIVKSISLDCRGAARRRLLDLGFVTGSEVEVSLENPLKEPKAFLIRNTMIALRNNQADFVLIEEI